MSGVENITIHLNSQKENNYSFQYYDIIILFLCLDSRGDWRDILGQKVDKHNNSVALSCSPFSNKYRYFSCFFDR